MIEIDLVSGVFLSLIGILAISSMALILKATTKNSGNDDFQTRFEI